MTLKPDWMAEADWAVIKELPYKRREKAIASLQKQPRKSPTRYADGVDPRYSARPKK